MDNDSPWIIIGGLAMLCLLGLGSSALVAKIRKPKVNNVNSSYQIKGIDYNTLQFGYSIRYKDSDNTEKVLYIPANDQVNKIIHDKCDGSSTLTLDSVVKYPTEIFGWETESCFTVHLPK